MYNQSSDELSRNDFAQMRALGFNMIRLCLSWSQLEPEPGVYSEMYLDRIEQMVGWAAEQGIYVILDMHEDLYTMYIFGDTAHQIPPYLVASSGQDGAPEWATLTDGWPALAILGIGNLNLASMKAFDNFYNNEVRANISQGAAPGPGLQDHYIGAIATLAKRFINSSAVIGFEIMNEPQIGTHLNPFVFADDYLYAMYARVIQAITGVRDGKPTCSTTYPLNNSCAYPDLGIHDTQHIFFCEPSAIRNLLDFSPQISKPFTSYPYIVHTPHTYTHVFTIDQYIHLPNGTVYPPSFDMAYSTARSEAAAMGAAVFVSEFGDGPDSDPRLLQPTTVAQDRYLTGASLWAWKSNCDAQDCKPNTGPWSVYDSGIGNPPPQNGALRPYRAELLSRVYPRAVSGALWGYTYTPEDQSFLLTANCTDSTPLETVLYIPRSVAGQVSTSKAAKVAQVIQNPDGSRFAIVQPDGTGVYSVAVGFPTAVTHPPPSPVEAFDPIAFLEREAPPEVNRFLQLWNDAATIGEAVAAAQNNANTAVLFQELLGDMKKLIR